MNISICQDIFRGFSQSFPHFLSFFLSFAFLLFCYFDCSIIFLILFLFSHFTLFFSQYFSATVFLSFLFIRPPFFFASIVLSYLPSSSSLTLKLALSWIITQTDFFRTLQQLIIIGCQPNEMLDKQHKYLFWVFREYFFSLLL